MRLAVAIVAALCALPAVAEERVFACTPEATAPVAPAPFAVRALRPDERMRGAACEGRRGTAFVYENFAAFLYAVVAPTEDTVLSRAIVADATDEATVADGAIDELDTIFFSGRNGLSRFSLSKPSDGPATDWRLDVVQGTPGSARGESGWCRPTGGS